VLSDSGWKLAHLTKCERGSPRHRRRSRTLVVLPREPRTDGREAGRGWCRFAGVCPGTRAVQWPGDRAHRPVPAAAQCRDRLGGVLTWKFEEDAAGSSADRPGSSQGGQRSLEGGRRQPKTWRSAQCSGPYGYFSPGTRSARSSAPVGRFLGKRGGEKKLRRAATASGHGHRCQHAQACSFGSSLPEVS